MVAIQSNVHQQGQFLYDDDRGEWECKRSIENDKNNQNGIIETCYKHQTYLITRKRWKKKNKIIWKFIFIFAPFDLKNTS